MRDESEIWTQGELRLNKMGNWITVMKTKCTQYEDKMETSIEVISRWWMSYMNNMNMRCYSEGMNFISWWGWSIMIQFLSMDNVILQYLYKKWKTEESEIIEKYRGDRPW